MDRLRSLKVEARRSRPTTRWGAMASPSAVHRRTVPGTTLSVPLLPSPDLTQPKMTAYRHYFSPRVMVVELQSSTGSGLTPAAIRPTHNPTGAHHGQEKSQEESSKEEEVTLPVGYCKGELTVIRLATASRIGKLITG